MAAFIKANSFCVHKFEKHYIIHQIQNRDKREHKSVNIYNSLPCPDCLYPPNGVCGKHRS